MIPSIHCVSWQTCFTYRCKAGSKLDLKCLSVGGDTEILAGRSLGSGYNITHQR